MCGSRVLRYRRGGRTAIDLHCRTQQSDLILQFCDLLRLRVELCALRVQLCAQECLETVDPVGFGAAGVGHAQGPRGQDGWRNGARRVGARAGPFPTLAQTLEI